MSRTLCFCVLFSVAWLSSSFAQDDALKFPDNFRFGVATSAYQIEGGWNEDGKTMSVWDRIAHTPGYVEDGTNGDIACDSYHKLDEDIRILKELGVDTYRFSLAWTRILPGGYKSQVNEKGVEYYNNLINKLIENNIEPVITIYHWDMPQIISTLGGLSNSLFIDYFANYARTAYKLFGDRVKTWITFNEPNMICHYFNYVTAQFSQQANLPYPSGVIEYICTKNLLKSHAEAYHIYNSEFKLEQKGRVGITLNCEWAEPASDSPEDIEAAERRLQFDFGIFANPIVKYDYPQVVIDRVAERSAAEGYSQSRLQPLTLTEKLRIKGTYDFIGLNHYTTWLVKNKVNDDPLDVSNFYTDTKVDREQDPSWESTGVDDNKVVPEGLYNLLKWIKKTYGNPEIIITECGYSDKDGDIEDDARINFFKGYMTSVLKAIHDGVKVTGFYAWSLMDNFEWIRGYTVRFGFYHVDFENDDRPRTARKSVEYYKKIITSKTIDDN